MSIAKIPLEELFVTKCESCGKKLRRYAYCISDGAYCKACSADAYADADADAYEEECREYAEAECKITMPFPIYDPDHEHRVTREEYEHGSRESYSRNAHSCHCRHQCTNYDSLIRKIAKDGSEASMVMYSAIRQRIQELVEDEIQRIGDKKE
jgi:hypothetical protein